MSLPVFCYLVRMDYHNRVFRPVQTTENGEVSADTTFIYQQVGNILTCSYNGASIKVGHLVGLVNEEGEIDMRYHQVNEAGELMTGICHSKPELLPDGRLRLHESWRWTSGDLSEGTSILEEVKTDPS